MLAAIAADAKMPVPKDKLDRARNMARQQRDLKRELTDAEAKVSSLKARIGDISRRELPDLLEEVGLKALSLEGDGDMPDYDLELQPFYHANIAADWEDERKQAAFDWLDENDHGDLIKAVVTVELARGENDARKRLEETLHELGMEFRSELTVPWNTLTAFVKEQIENGEALPLELLGATVGKVVKMKERKK